MRLRLRNRTLHCNADVGESARGSQQIQANDGLAPPVSDAMATRARKAREGAGLHRAQIRRDRATIEATFVTAMLGARHAFPSKSRRRTVQTVLAPSRVGARCDGDRCAYRAIRPGSPVSLCPRAAALAGVREHGCPRPAGWAEDCTGDAASSCVPWTVAAEPRGRGRDRGGGAGCVLTISSGAAVMVKAAF